MARINREAKLLDMGGDIRLQALGFAAVGIWLALINLIRELGVDDVVTFGMGRAPSLADVARIRFQMDETELETHLKTQSETQLITWDATTRTLGYGPDQQASRRTLANRANGAKGGRPRKNQVTERSDPAQRHLPPMAIAGGVSVKEKSKTETQTGASVSPAKLAHTESIKAVAIAREPTKAEIDAAYHRIGSRAFEVAGFDLARDRGDYRVARQWAADGLQRGMTADQIEQVVVETVETVTARERGAGRVLPHMGYFKPAVAQAIERFDVHAPRTVEDHLAQEAWQKAMGEWMRSGGKGPQPQLVEFSNLRAA
ncbi:hypothetical protein AA23498_2669 [Acetobacter nitrogenifigens DSM 23921 = NBRC 105050]|uniref:hypothetical protein n=1 Tax=Acetobacter nitrogenifigens TaxID=285268 RepID=UPI002156BD9D|nr:hypothetical protein [Acetobacter nitrogenifigens]GBQ96555.1 hypothetical protein AA23498_2669 [Acetobacter nitrogenifigens DSM 23921 = NBRC 105050]